MWARWSQGTDTLPGSSEIVRPTGSSRSGDLLTIEQDGGVPLQKDPFVSCASKSRNFEQVSEAPISVFKLHTNEVSCVLWNHKHRGEWLAYDIEGHLRASAGCIPWDGTTSFCHILMQISPILTILAAYIRENCSVKRDADLLRSYGCITRLY